jgi:hypothetical protein
MTQVNPVALLARVRRRSETAQVKVTGLTVGEQHLEDMLGT